MVDDLGNDRLALFIPEAGNDGCGGRNAPKQGVGMTFQVFGLTHGC
jgi:hypothetical protein